jgi:ABC-type glycerol-3-phosphate transport system permease component
MNALHWFLLALLAVFGLLMLLSRRAAWSYARFTTLVIAGTIILMPFAWLICAAFKDKTVLNEYSFLPPPASWTAPTVKQGDKLVPVKSLAPSEIPPADQVLPPTINLNNFRRLFEPRDSTQGPVTFWRYVSNSLFLASAGTFLTLTFSSMGGYALAKYRFALRTPVMLFMLASLTIPGVVLLSPNFEIIYKLGWMDSFKALLIPGAVSVFGIFLFRQAIMTVPNDILEAGRIDGCGEFRIYLTLVMPLVRPVIGAFCLIAFLGSWNAFIGPNVFLHSQDKLPLPVVLNQYIGIYAQEYGVFLAGTLLAIIPPAVLFFALQREFISGLTTGAVKQ